MNTIPYGYIYVIINKINNKTYIGCRKLSLDKSWRQYMGSGKLIKQAFSKYNKENFTKTLLEYSFGGGEKELKILEEYYIKFYKKNGDGEYNIYSNSSAGGDTFSKLKNKTLEEVKLSQSIGVKKAIESGGASAKTKHNNILKYCEVFENIGLKVIDYYNSGYSLLDCEEKFKLPLERIRIFLKDSGVTLRNRRLSGHGNSTFTNEKISQSIKSKIILKSGETLLEAHNRLIKYSHEELVKDKTLKKLYEELDVSKTIFNRFVKNHNVNDCEYCLL